MKELIKDIYMVDGIGSANVFLLVSEDGFVLIDTGIFKMTHHLIAQIEAHGFDMAKLKTIYLTHCHCDHIGGVSELVKYSGAKVAAHSMDIPYILGEKVIDGLYHNMMVEEQKVMKKLGCDVKKVDIALEDGDTIDVLGGMRVILVPGHTPGSIALYLEQKKALFFGDVIRNNPKTGLTIAKPEKFNLDTKQTRADAKKLLELPIEFALFSHGTPILANANTLLNIISM